MADEKVIYIDLKDGLSLRLKTRMYSQSEDDEPIDLDKLLMIDIAHLEAEIISFPVLLNMLGLALADATNRYNESKLSLDIYEGKFKEKVYNDQDDYDEDEETGKKKIKKYKKPTVDEVDAQLKNDKIWQAKKKSMYTKQKEMEYMNSIYWSAKSKDDKLNKLSQSIKAGDVYDVLAVSKLTRINNVDLKLVKPLIQ